MSAARLFCVIAMPIGTPVRIASPTATPTIDTCWTVRWPIAGRLFRMKVSVSTTLLALVGPLRGSGSRRRVNVAQGNHAAGLNPTRRCPLRTLAKLGSDPIFFNWGLTPFLATYNLAASEGEPLRPARPHQREQRMMLSITNLQRGACRLLGLSLLLVACAVQAVNWNYLEGPFGGQPLGMFVDSDANTWAGMNGSGVYFRPAGTSNWLYRPGLPNQSNSRFTEDGDGTVYVSGSGGLYAHAVGAAAWGQVSGTNGLPGEAAAGLATDSARTVYAAMNNQ